MNNLQQDSEKTGTLYGVSVGPGDPELLTVKAMRVLKHAPVIFTPRAEGTCDSIALDIVKGIVDTTRQKIVFASFPMGMGEPTKDIWKMKKWHWPR